MPGSKSGVFSVYFALRGYFLAALLGMLIWMRTRVDVPLKWEFLILIAAGMILRSWAGAYLGIHGNASRAHAPALAQNGPYRISRNPLYVSNLLVGAGLLLFANCLSVRISILVLIVLFAHHALLVKWEEQNLRAQWGGAYAAYLRKTPRWLGWPGASISGEEKIRPHWNKVWERQTRNLAYTLVSVLLVWGGLAVEMNRSAALWIYRAAWEPVLWLGKAAAILNLVPRWRLAERLGWKWRKRSKTPRVWMHAASLGECKGLWALAHSLRDLPVSFVLTANTTAGLEFLSRQIESLEEKERCHALLAPCDHPGVVRKFLRHFQVRALILFEVELWPHFILTAKRENKPVLWVSARLTARAKKSHALFPRMTRTLLESLTWTQTQNGEEADALRDCGCETVEAGADLRGLHYVDAPTFKTEKRDWKDRHGVAFLSLHASEISSVLPAIESRQDMHPIFIFPRKLEELPQFQKALEPLGFVPYSKNPQSHLLIVDAFGKIPEFLERCHTAVVGGSFAPYGGHNLWEPLLAGTAMIVGPYHSNQAYLASKLEASGLLRISPAVPTAENFQKPDLDPDPACRNFIENEKALLHTAADRIFALALQERVYRDEQ